MALPADGYPTLEGRPDNGKEHGKLWLNEADMVSEDHGEELKYSSPPQSVDCSTSSTDSNITSSSGSSTNSSSEDEVGNGDQDDFRSRFRVVQVLRPNIKFLWGMGVLEHALKLLKSTVDHLGSGDSSLTVVLADVASQLPEILPHNFKYIQDIGVAQKPQEDMTPCNSVEFPSGLDKQKEPILRPEKSRPIGTLQHHQVGLEEDAAHVTSVTGINGKRTKNSDAEEEPPAKRTKYSVLSFPYQKTEYDDPIELPPVLSLSTLTSCEDPVLSSPVLSPSTPTHFEDPTLSSPVLSPSTPTHFEDPILPPSVFSLSPMSPYEDPILSSPVLSPSTPTHFEDPILSPLVFSPSPSIHFENSTLSSPDFFFWMGTEEDTEEEAIPSTSSGITARESSRHVFFRPHYVLSSDSD